MRAAVRHAATRAQTALIAGSSALVRTAAGPSRVPLRPAFQASQCWALAACFATEATTGSIASAPVEDGDAPTAAAQPSDGQVVDAEVASVALKRRGRPPRSAEEKAATKARRQAQQQKEKRATTAKPRRNSAEIAFENALGTEIDLDLFQYPHLPSPSEWKTAFATNRAFSASRYVLANKNTVKAVIASLGLDELAKKGIKTTVIEGYPGLGTLTRELLEHPAVEKVIALEDSKFHLKFLGKLKADPELGPKLTVLPHSAYFWKSYDEILDGGHLDHLSDRIRTSSGEPTVFSTKSYGKAAPSPQDDPTWKADSPILFLAQLPSNVYGDQLFAQLIFAIASRRWLFRFSRIRLAFMLNKGILGRVLAQPGEQKFTRTAAVTHTLTDIVPTPFSKYESIEPYAAHFYPSRQQVGLRLLANNRSIPAAKTPSMASKMGIGLLHLEPKKDLTLTPDIFEEFEYLTRMLFVLRTTDMEAAMKRLAPGAENVLKMLNMRGAPEERIDPKQSVQSLTPPQWAGLSRMFKLWPFRPPD
ncbi:hypothetical protein OC844_004036 [Tilletia horrida]|nr:hypothetical protein OC844_004036 [Tilletia horrida]